MVEEGIANVIVSIETNNCGSLVVPKKDLGESAQFWIDKPNHFIVRYI